MKWVLPTAFLQQLPLLAIFVIPLIQAAFGWRRNRMKSAVHFQQGTVSSSPWRVAVIMTVLILPQFCLWCLLMRGPSSLFFLLGSCFAVPLSIVSVGPILHYIPSPSVVAYIQHRFSSGNLRFWVASLQALMCFLVSLVILFQTSNLLASATAFPFLPIISLISFVSFISVALSGHSSIMNPPLFFNLIVILAGITLLLYFGIEHVTSFETIFPMRYSLTDSVVSTCVGFVVCFYHLTSSPMFYQAFFPLSTIHKLRLALVLFAVFQLFACILIYLATSLYISFLEKHCTLPYSFSSMFQFIKVTVSHKAEAYLVVAALSTVLIMFFQWQLLTLASHLWEEFLKARLRSLSPRKQLRVIQLTLFMTTVTLTLMSLAIRFLRLPLQEYIPATILAAFVLCSIVAGIFLCGYFFPCSNSKGSITSFFVTTLIFSGFFYLCLAKNGFPQLSNGCFGETTNSTVSQRSHHFDRFVSVLTGIPIEAHPIFALLTAVLLCLLISFVTGGQDQMSLDWNLVVFPCAPLMKGRSTYAKRPVVESESFRFAQQFNVPPAESPH